MRCRDCAVQGARQLTVREGGKENTLESEGERSIEQKYVLGEFEST